MNVRQNDGKFNAVTLNYFLAYRLEKYKIPRAIEAVEVLIKTFNGGRIKHFGI